VGCSTGYDTSSSGDSQISVTGQATAPIAVISSIPPNTVVGSMDLAGVSMGLAAGGSLSSLPFVRNAPEGVAPFPLVLNETVQRYVDSYLAQPEGLQRSFERSGPYMTEMVSVLKNQGLPKDLVYLTFAESGFADTGAGPWQLSRETARRFGLEINSWVDERRDPIKSTRAAAAYLAALHDQVDSDWRMTLVAWNNGDSGVDRYRDLRDLSYEMLVSRLPARTRQLLNRFMAVALIARHSREYGISEAGNQQPASYRVVTVKGGTRLSTVAQSTHTSLVMLRELNPGLLRLSTPPGESYGLRVPGAVVSTEL
jgi:membrane-bound lytic murein transglycosylase D